MRRQTMHKQACPAGFRHEPFINLIRLEHLDALFQFMFLAHAGPHVRIDCAGAFHRVRFAKPRDVLSWRRTESPRAYGAETNAGQFARLPERAGHIVPVADICHDLAFEIPPHVPQRQDVRDRLAGMFPVAEGVDDRHGREARHFLQIGMLEYTRDNAIHPERQIAGKIWNRFPFSQAALYGSEQNRPAAQLADSHLECHPRTQRRLFENERQVLSRQRILTAATALRPRQEQKVGKLGPGKLAEREHV